MDLTPALPTFVITLREGVEAALVVGIVLACLSKANQQQLYPWVLWGVVAGIGGSIVTGIVLAAGLQELQVVLPNLENIVKPLLETLFASIAIVMLSWMLLWMTQQARTLKVEITGTVTSALQQSSAAGWSIFSLICIAVLREGFETVLFIFANVGDGSPLVGGAIAGLIGATLIGLALFRWGIRINIRLFFQAMGVLLLLIVAGLVVSALKNLDAVLAALHLIYGADLCISNQSCILGPLVWDASTILPDRQFPGIILKSLLGYRDHIYLLQLLGYVLFLTGIGSRYWRNLEGPRETTPAES